MSKKNKLALNMWGFLLSMAVIAALTNVIPPPFLAIPLDGGYMERR